NATQHQVSMRQLTYTTPAQTKTVQATGVGHIPAKTARGTLTFFNGSTNAFTVSSTIPIPSANGVEVLPDTSATIPGARPPTEGTVTVSAHATTAGTAGNIGAGSISGNCCTAGGFVTVTNSAFTGGQDQKDYSFLRQSDVNGVVNSLQQSQSSQAINAFKGQIKPNEQLLAAPKCNPTTNVDQPIGDHGQNITSANVTVTASCT